MAGFSRSIDRFVDKAKVRRDTVFRAVILEMIGRLIAVTPVDEGRAQGAWMVGVKQRPSGTPPEGQRGQAAISEAQSKLNSAAMEQTIWVVNNVPYIIELEHGSSIQAPRGILGQVIPNFKGIVFEKSKRKK